MPASVSQSGTRSHRSRSRGPRQRSSRDVASFHDRSNGGKNRGGGDSDGPIVDISSIDSGNLSIRHADGGGPLCGNATAFTGLTKSTKGTTGTWSSREESSHNHNNRRGGSRGRSGGSRAASAAVREALEKVGGERRGGRSRSRPPDIAVSRGGVSRGGDNEAARGGVPNSIGRSSSSHPRYNNSSSSNVKNNDKAIPVAAAATMAAAQSVAGSRRGGSRSRSRVRERGGHGEGQRPGGNDANGRLHHHHRRGGSDVRGDSRRPTTEQQRRPPGGIDPTMVLEAALSLAGAVPAREGRRGRGGWRNDVRLSVSGAKSVGGASFHGLKHPIDQDQASHDSHHHRQGSRYRNGGRRRGHSQPRRGQSRTRSPQSLHGEHRQQRTVTPHSSRSPETARRPNAASGERPRHPGQSLERPRLDDRARSRSQGRNHDGQQQRPGQQGHERHHRPGSPGAQPKKSTSSRYKPPPPRSNGGGGGDRDRRGRPQSPLAKESRRHDDRSRPRPREQPKRQPPPRRQAEQQQHRERRRDARSCSPGKAREQQLAARRQTTPRRLRSTQADRPGHLRDGRSKSPGAAALAWTRNADGRQQSQPKHHSRSPPTSRLAQTERSGLLHHPPAPSSAQEQPRQQDRRAGTTGLTRRSTACSKSPFAEDRYGKGQPAPQERRRGGTPGPCRRNTARSKSPQDKDGYGEGQVHTEGHRRGGTPGPYRRSQSPTEPSTRGRASPNKTRRGGTPGPTQGRSPPYLPENSDNGTLESDQAQPFRRSSKSSFASCVSLDDCTRGGYADGDHADNGSQTDASSYYSRSESGTALSSSSFSVTPHRHGLHGSTNSSGGSARGGGVAHSVVSSDQSNYTEGSRHFLSSEGSVDLNRNGCCVRHPFVRLQRPNPNGGGWRIMSRTCVLCLEEGEEEAERRRKARAKVSSAASVGGCGASKAAMVKDIVKDAAASVMSIRSRQGSSHQGASKTPPPTQAKRHPLERRHSLLNTTPRRSIIMDDLNDHPSCEESTTDETPDDGEEDESITPSFLELDDEKSASVASRGSSSCFSSEGSEPSSGGLDLNSLGEPLTPPSVLNELMLERAVSELVSELVADAGLGHVDEQRSVASRRSRKSHKSNTTRSIHHQNSKDNRQHAEQEIIVTEIVVPSDEKSVDSKKSKRSISSSRRRQSSSVKEKEQKPVDMLRVESALRKIKSMEKIQQAEAATVANEVTSKSVTSKSVNSKSANSNQQQPVKGVNVPKSPRRPPPPRGPNKSTTKRPPPPPPPPRPNKPKSTVGKINNNNNGIKNNSNNTAGNNAKTTGAISAPGNDSKNQNNINYDTSTAVLNPHPEPELHELQGEFPLVEYTPQPMPQQQQPLQHPLPQHPNQLVEYTPQPLPQQQPQQPHPLESFPEFEVQGQEVDKSKEWMKYSTGFARREQKAAAEAENGGGKNSNGKKSKFMGRSAKRAAQDQQRPAVHNVKQMPFTDQFGDFGFYTGSVDEDGRPDGKGSMKYENGVFYEGTWAAGCQDKSAASQYERIRGGFTSWSGKGKSGIKSGTVLPWNARKNDTYDAQSKTNVRGMQWTDLKGDSGRYTGEVNNDQLPHGNGIMKYDFGLIAEGEWVNGVLKEGPQDRLLGVAAAMNGGQSVAPGMAINSGMSVGPGAAGFASGAVSVLGGGGISVAPPGGFGGGMVMAQQPQPFMSFGGMNPMMAMANQSRQASQHAMIAHQNLMMKAGMGGSVYGGGASVYAGPGMPMQQLMPAMQVQQPLQQVPQQQDLGNKPPVSEIKLG